MDRRRWGARLRAVLTVALLSFVVTGFTACSLSLPDGGARPPRPTPTPEHVVSAWLASDGHCAILMSTHYVELGADETSLYWTLVFARPR